MSDKRLAVVTVIIVAVALAGTGCTSSSATPANSDGAASGSLSSGSSTPTSGGFPVKGVVAQARTAALTPAVETACAVDIATEGRLVAGSITTVGELLAATDGTPYALDPEMFGPAEMPAYLCVVDAEGQGNLPPGITRLTFVRVPLEDGVNVSSAWVDGF